MELKDLKRPIAIVSVGCRTITAEWENWAQQIPLSDLADRQDAKTVVVLGCQVTDLAILNDLRVAEDLKMNNPEKEIVIGGCLAARDDVNFEFSRVTIPLGIPNLDSSSFSSKRVRWQRPFWDSQENFLRDGVSVRTSRGCKSACAYCSINKVRGGHEVYPIRQRNVVAGSTLIADSPSVDEVLEFLEAARVNGARVSLRNLEPEVAIGANCVILAMANMHLLDTWHVPIQSTNPEVVEKMRRNPEMVGKIISLARVLRLLGVRTATNIIENFVPGDTSPNAESFFDHVTRNPYWDGKWDRDKAEAHWARLSPWFWSLDG